MTSRNILKIFSLFILLQGILMGATIKQLQLNNTEIPVIFEKHKTLPIFNLQLVFKNSGYSQDANNNGITNLVAKMLNEGTLQDGSVNFARKLENEAISIHTSNGFETFVIEVSCLKDQYKKALVYLDEILTTPNMSQDTLDKIKMLQVAKLKQKENDFDYVAGRKLKSIIFNETPLQIGNSGTIDSIEKITLDDIKEQYKKIINLDNLIIVTGGDIKYKEFKQEIFPVVSKFDSKGKTSLNKISASSQTDTEIIYKETEQAYVYFGSAFNINYDSKDAYKAKVASFILGGGGFGSRLMEEIRVKNGLAYSAYGNISNNRSHSYFSGYLQTKIKNQEKAQKLVTKIIKDFVKNGVSKEELKAAKKFLMGSEPLRTETFSQRQNRAFYLYYKGLDQNYPQKELQLIEELTLKDLNSFIKEHKEIKNLSFSIVTAKQTIKGE